MTEEFPETVDSIIVELVDQDNEFTRETPPGTIVAEGAPIMSKLNEIISKLPPDEKKVTIATLIDVPDGYGPIVMRAWAELCAALHSQMPNDTVRTTTTCYGSSMTIVRHKTLSELIQTAAENEYWRRKHEWNKKQKAIAERVGEAG